MLLLNINAPFSGDDMLLSLSLVVTEGGIIYLLFTSPAVAKSTAESGLFVPTPRAKKPAVVSSVPSIPKFCTAASVLIPILVNVDTPVLAYTFPIKFPVTFPCTLPVTLPLKEPPTFKLPSIKHPPATDNVPPTNDAFVTVDTPETYKVVVG